MVAIRHELVKGWSLAECELIASFSPVFRAGFTLGAKCQGATVNPV
jgi:hypothetical protein